MSRNSSQKRENLLRSEFLSIQVGDVRRILPCGSPDPEKTSKPLARQRQGHLFAESLMKPQAAGRPLQDKEVAIWAASCIALLLLLALGGWFSVVRYRSWVASAAQPTQIDAYRAACYAMRLSQGKSPLEARTMADHDAEFAVSR